MHWPFEMTSVFPAASVPTRQSESPLFFRAKKKEPRENSWFVANSLKSAEDLNAENNVLKGCKQLKRFLFLFGSSAKL